MLYQRSLSRLKIAYNLCTFAIYVGNSKPEPFKTSCT